MVRVLFILGQYCNLWLRCSFKGRERNWGEKNDRGKTGVKKKKEKKRSDGGQSPAVWEWTSALHRGWWSPAPHFLPYLTPTKPHSTYLITPSTPHPAFWMQLQDGRKTRRSGWVQSEGKPELTNRNKHKLCNIGRECLVILFRQIQCVDWEEHNCYMILTFCS